MPTSRNDPVTTGNALNPNRVIRSTAAMTGSPERKCGQPAHKTHRGRGKSDPIDAHLAVLAALRLNADRLPTPRADGDRKALRILLGARQELTPPASRRPTGSARCYWACGVPERVRPPRIGRRRILPRTGSGTSDAGRGGRNCIARCGRAVL